MEKIRVRLVRGENAHYRGLWSAYHGKAFLPFAYGRTLDSLMDRICAKLKARKQKRK